MCGLVGGIGLWDDKDRSVFSTLFMVNALRGPHSSGVISCYTTYGKDGGNFYASRRSMEPSSSYIYTQEYDEILSDKPRLIAGHSRFATRGKVNINNAHPFKCGKIIGMHNGTISGKFEGSYKFETDSEGLFSLISKVGLKEALDNVYKEANNTAYCLVYMDLKDNSVNIIRNEQRPMYLAKHKNNPGKMYWASESVALMFALVREGIYDEYEISSLKPGTLVKIYPYIYEAEKKIIITPDFYTPPAKPVVTTYYRGNNYNDAWRQSVDKTNEQLPFDKPTNNTTDEKDTKRTGTFADVSKSLDEVLGEKEPPVETTKDKLKKAIKNQNKEVDYFRVGEIFASSTELDHSLSKGCMVCNQPSVILNNNITKIHFLENQKTDHVCSSCYDKYGPQKLGLDYGLFNLVTPKLIKKN